MRVRIGPVRVGGGRRPSFTAGIGPIGVTVGGRRKRSGGTSSRTPSTSTSSYEAPSQEELERRHVIGISNAIWDQAADMVHYKPHDALIESAWLNVFIYRCSAMCGFGLLVLLTTKNVEHVLALYLAFLCSVTVNFSPAAMAYRRSTDPSERQELWDGSDKAIQLGRSNFSAGFLPVWLLIFGAFAIEALFDVEANYSNVISLHSTVALILVYSSLVILGTAWATKSRTKTNSNILLREEMKLLAMNHLFISVPKTSMLKYEILRLRLAFLQTAENLRNAITDPVYAAYRSGSDREIVEVTNQIEALESKLRISQAGRDLLALAAQMYRDPNLAENLEKQRKYLAERSAFWESVSGDRFKPPPWRDK